MASVKVLNREGQDAGSVELTASVFEATTSPSLVHQAVVTELSEMRQGTHKVKTRSEVRGGGRKPWRQKGTGRARQGSIRAAHWRKGGIIHGPVPRDHSLKLNRKMHEGAVRGALTSRTSDGLIVVDQLLIESGKTKDMVRFLDAVGARGKVLIITDEYDVSTILALRNLPNILDVTTPNDLSVYDILNANAIVATRGAVEIIGEVYAK